MTGMMVCVVSAHAYADALPTPDDLQTLLAAKNWTGLLQATSRVLALQGPATAAFNRVDVWMLKAEAQLQSSQFTPASVSFDHAAAEKGATPEQQDLALASSALMKKSDHKGYQAKATAADPAPAVYDINDPAKRKTAIGALLNVECDALSARIDKLKTSSDIRAVTDLAKQAGELAPLDRVANGSAAKTDALQKQIGDNFVAAVQTWSDRTTTQLDDLNNAANKTTQIPQRDASGRTYYRDQKAGLTSTQQGQIRQIQQDAQRLAATYQAAVKSLDVAGKTAMDPSKDLIQRVYDHADQVRKDALLQN